MDKSKSFRQYRTMSQGDRFTFNCWLTANAAVGLILAAGLVAMAVAGSYPGCDLGCGKKSPDVIAAGQLPK
jgi:hypothetical protein